MTTDRADKITTAANQQVFFSDFFTNFNVHPNSGALMRVTNENAVKLSIKNIVLTNIGERLYQPSLGGNIRRSLFEPMDGFTKNTLEDDIRETIYNEEKRVRTVQVLVIPDEINNLYKVTITFTVFNNPEISTVELTLKRIR